MKTCRFCNHEQEEGDRCEACGSPFSADKLDFSGETMPDPTQSVTSAQDSSIWGAASSESPVAETSVPQPAAVETTMPEAETVSSDASVTGAPGQKAPEADVPKTAPQPTPPKIMYSAAARSETVYLKKKGTYTPSHGMTILPPAQNTGSGEMPSVSASVPAYAPVPSKMSDEQFKKYAGLYKHSLITLIISIIGLFCFCGGSMISVILSSLAYSDLSAIKNGSTAKDPDKAASSAKVKLIVADILLVVGLIFAVVLGTQLIGES